MNKKTILMILNQRFLPDIRVDQEYRALKEKGCRVIVVASDSGYDDKDFEIVRLKHKDNITSKLSNLFNLTLSFNPLISSEIKKKLISIGVHNVDLIHVHDLFWSFLGLQLKKHFKCKLIIDLHENYPEMKRDDLTDRKILEPKHIIRPFHFFKKIFVTHMTRVNRFVKYEKKVLKKCDGFIVVVDEALEHYKKMGFDNKGTIVSNTKDPSLWSFEPLPEKKGKLVVSYVGTIQGLRGLETVIRSMQYLDQQDYEINLVGFKPNTKIYADCASLVKSLNINNINLVEFINNENEAFRYISNAHVCIVPHKKTNFTETTIPHKLFIYMAIGRPVIVSDVAPLKRVVAECKAGYIYKAEDPYDFAEKLKQINNIHLLKQFALNGRKAVENKYNWKYDKHRLLSLYSKLLVD